MVVSELKSSSAIRIVPMPESVKDALSNKEKVVESLYVFCTSRGTPFSPRNIDWHFKKVLQTANLPQTIRLHDLRHTIISYMFFQYGPVKDVQVIAGHADFSTTMDIYGHLMPGGRRKQPKRWTARLLRN